MEVGIGITYTLLFISLYFEVFLLVSFLEKRKRRETIGGKNPDDAALPSVAIVVPCFNEEKSVAGTLRSLLALRYPKEKLEVIVVDDGSRDATYSVAREFENDERVRIFRKENGGKHTAMNLALANTKADLIGCLDADSVVETDALLRIARVFENSQVAAVTPGIHVRAPQTLLQHMQKVEYRLSIFNRFMLAALGSAFITPGPFSVFRTRIVRELGGWRHGHFTEDMEMALRIQVAGHLIANAPAAVVHTTAPRTLPTLFRQRVRWTYGFLRNAFDYRYMLGSRQYGNLGLIVMPLALISVGAGIYFFIRVLFSGGMSLVREVARIQSTGIFPEPHFGLFYVNTSALWFLAIAAVVMVLVLICLGSLIGTGRRRPPMGTPLFLLFYSFLAPLWLSAALVRAVFRTGVNWR